MNIVILRSVRTVIAAVYLALVVISSPILIPAIIIANLDLTVRAWWENIRYMLHDMYIDTTKDLMYM